MLNQKMKATYAAAFLILFFGVGIAGLAMPSFHSLFVRLTPLTLLLSLVILLLFHDGWNLRFVVFCMIVFVVGLFLEAFGVNTGVIFGDYTYGPVLGLKIWNTPLMIGINWLMLSYTTWDMVGRIKFPVAFRVITAAILMVVFDFIMEPVAIKMGMWAWDGDVIPLKNYLAWFVISLLFFMLAAFMKIEIRNKVSVPLWLILFSFFVLLQLFNI